MRLCEHVAQRAWRLSDRSAVSVDSALMLLSWLLARLRSCSDSRQPRPKGLVILLLARSRCVSLMNGVSRRTVRISLLDRSAYLSGEMAPAFMSRPSTSDSLFWEQSRYVRLAILPSGAMERISLLTSTTDCRWT